MPPTCTAQRKRPNYTCDSQHVQAHFQPAYGFIGIWAPCERGYYNHHLDRDNYEFYGSLERYYAYKPVARLRTDRLCHRHGLARRLELRRC